MLWFVHKLTCYFWFSQAELGTGLFNLLNGWVLMLPMSEVEGVG